MNILEKLRARLAEVDDPAFREMLEERIAELSQSSRPSYEAVHDELEEMYVSLVGKFGYTKKFKERWTPAREGTLGRHGWTVKEFYAEMDRRRKMR